MCLNNNSYVQSIKVSPPRHVFRTHPLKQRPTQMGPKGKNKGHHALVQCDDVGTYYASECGTMCGA